MNILSKLTKNYLKLNKKRTIVTIIGIIISGAMVSGVLTIATSFQQFMIEVEKENTGSWQAEFINVPYEDVKYIENNPNFTDIGITVPVTIADNIYSQERFLTIEAMDKKGLETLGVRLISGKLPQNSNEIAISKTFFDGKDNEPSIGDTINFAIGEVIEVQDEKGEIQEQLKKTGEKTYTICGMVAKLRFEGGSDYTSAVTFWDDKIPVEGKKVSVGIQSKKVKNIYQDTEQMAENLGLFTEKRGEKFYSVKYNTNVLLYMGINNTDGFLITLYGVCGILILVIGIGSILVIYNSFAISVSERKKQFGMLSSIGATKKQIKRSVLVEGAILGGIGIPIGILAGIGGIGITLYFVNGLIKSAMADIVNWELGLCISWESIFIAAVLIVITIYISVILPARRASKISPIEAIRQNDDVKISGKKVKTPKLIRKLFGEEGDIALKNLKRSKKRYRTTVISLVISIILFITVSGFINDMSKGFGGMYQVPEYDFRMTVYNYKNKEKAEKATKEIENISQATKMTVTKSYYGVTRLSEDKIDKNLREMTQETYIGSILESARVKDYYQIGIKVMALDEKTYKQYLKEVGLSKLEENEVVLINYVNDIADNKIEYHMTNYEVGENILLSNGYEKEREKTTEYKIAKVTDKIPWGISNSEFQLMAITSEKGLQRAEELEERGNLANFAYMKIDKKDREEIKVKLKQWQQDYADIDANYYDVQSQVQTERNLRIIIQIFLYGFITLISLIGIANIFNTISTNINLRRREFANLKSIGMTDKQFKRMLDLECFFYGTKAILYGIPLGVLICYLLNKTFGATATFLFRIPWSAIIISIIAVYAIVFITMLYSSKKVKKENIMDVLRDDNI